MSVSKEDYTERYEELREKKPNGAFYTSKLQFNGKGKLITDKPIVSYQRRPPYYDDSPEEPFIKCYFCDETFHFDDIAQHINNCEYYPFKCDHCKKAIFTMSGYDFCKCGSEKPFITYKVEFEGKTRNYEITSSDVNWVIFMYFEEQWERNRA